ncbi:MAG TPA: hypothetical protein VNJ03_10450 [Vicinamibacterales bacterium]|nr:hypothetical protein [Vicinamibacterales bacterium]
MAVKRKTWIWVLVGIGVVGILFVIAMAGAGIYFFSQNIETRTATTTVAASEFDRIRAQFTGQKPLIELDSNGDFLRSNTDRPVPASPEMPENLYVLAFDPDDGGLVRVTIPFWLLRLKMKGATINFSGNQMDLEDLKLTVEDLERFGPSLVLDQQNEGGDRVLVWSQ